MSVEGAARGLDATAGLDWMSAFGLLLHPTRKWIGFDVASIGEVQFFHDVLAALLERLPGAVFTLFHAEDTADELARRYPAIASRVMHVRRDVLLHPLCRRLDLFITTEQFVPGPPGVYTIALFHGQPSKGVTFELGELDVLAANDALFMYGPLQRRALSEHMQLTSRALPPHLETFDVGYSKTDRLLRDGAGREDALRELAVPPDRPTVLYAPAFNEGASLREVGVEIIQTLARMTDWNVLAKLPIDCQRPVSDLAATGGVDWPATLAALEASFPNFRLVRSDSADRALVAADVLVTCVSSISFDSLVLGRRVVFIETPKFYERWLPLQFPGLDTSAWAARDTVNGGKRFGAVVEAVADLPAAVRAAHSRGPVTGAAYQALLHELLFNPGEATAAAVSRIVQLLEEGRKSRRPREDAARRLARALGRPTAVARLRRGVRRVASVATKPIRTELRRLGYDVRPVGLPYLPAAQTIDAARRAQLSVCDHLESLEPDVRKRGRRDRIIDTLRVAGALERVERVCEIGPGTGRYLERVLELVTPQFYELYETDPGWVHYLEETYGNRVQLTCHAADGVSLTQTADASCGLVHAHAVFVYLPALQTLEYLEHAIRVCAPGGCIVFDYLVAEDLGYDAAERWLAGPHRFPVFVARRLLNELAERRQLRVLTRFKEVYGSGEVEYLVWQKPRPEGTRTLTPPRLCVCVLG